MELEEAIRLEKWKENVPMMTIEGQPLSENVKKRRDALVAYATAKAQANGGLFEDSGGPYNDAAISAMHNATISGKQLRVEKTSEDRAPGY